MCVLSIKVPVQNKSGNLYAPRRYMSNIIWFSWVLWHINHCRLFDTKLSLYIYIIYIWFGLVGISNIVGYVLPNPLWGLLCLVAPKFMLVYIWKGKWSEDVSDVEKRTFKTKQYKQNWIYISRNTRKKKPYKYSNIVCWIFLCVCMY